MTLMMITEKICTHTDMSDTPLSMPPSALLKKKGAFNNTAEKKQKDSLCDPKSDHELTDVASLSESISRLEETNIDKLLYKEDENLLSNVSLEPPVFKVKPESNLKSASQGFLQNDSTNVHIKQDMFAVSVPKTTEQSSKKKVNSKEASKKMSKMAAKPREHAFLRRSNSDISLHRFRIATEDSDSVKSIKSSPFQPKPPITPRKTHPLHIQAKTKFNCEPDSLEDKATCADDQQDVSQLSSTYDQHKPKLSSNPMELITRQPSSSGLNSYHYDSDISDQYSPNQVGSVLTVRSLPTPSSPRLPPISSVSSLPPFNQNFSSKTLRTAYKSEPLFHAHQLNGGSMETFSQGSFASSSASVLSAITTREARSR